MNARLKDLLLIAVAMIVILGCGYGLGNAFAPRKVTPPPPEVSLGNFQEAAITNLDSALDLTPEQEEAIRSELEETAGQIRAARREALLKYYLHLLALHDKIDPKLEPEQQETLRKNKQLLQDTIENRFGKSLDDLRSTLGNGSQDPGERP